MDAFRAQLDAANRKIDARQLEQLESLCGVRGEVTLGWPFTTPLTRRHFDSVGLQNRVIYWPSGMPSLRTTAIVSSRLGRRLDSKDDLFRVLRAACGQLDPRRQMLLCANGTSLSSFVRRAAFLFGLSVCTLNVPVRRREFATWLRSLTHIENSPDEFACWVSPTLDPSCEDGELPLRDRLEVLLPEQILALHVRKSGYLETLLSSRLAQGDSKVFLALGSNQLVPPVVAETLMSQGAVGWFVRTHDAKTSAQFERRVDTVVAPRIPVPPTKPWPYLTHCTRRATGKWPDQEEDEFLDELILGELSRDRSNLAALLRIIGTRTLLATGAAIRARQRIVSFTSVDLADVGSLRTFRAHRGRWDFEPYGICIRRDFMVQLGAQAVLYGSEATWEQLPAVDRPFFQKTAESPEDEGMDWRAEKEWRHQGDLDLETVPCDAGFVFVPSDAEADHVCRVSRWPVAVVQWDTHGD